MSAKKPSARHDASIRIDLELVTQAKKVAALRGTSVARYLSNILRPVIQRDLAAEYQAIASEVGKG